MTMLVSEVLHIRSGVTAIIGGGGKTTLCQVLARELAQAGMVLFCTTTKIFPTKSMVCLKDPSRDELAYALTKHKLVCAGSFLPETGKLGALPIPMKELMQMADYVIVEADGAKHLPLKAHLDFEPVIPPEANQTIYVVGASGFGRPVRQAAHRWERYAALVGVTPDTPVTPEMVARVLRREGGFDQVLVNQIETAYQKNCAVALAEQLPCPVWYGALQKNEINGCRL